MYVYHFHLTSLVFNVFASQINSAFQKMAITQFNLIFRLILQTCNGIKKKVSAAVQEEIETEIDP